MEKNQLSDFFKQKIQKIKSSFEDKTQNLRKKNSMMTNNFKIHEKWQNHAKKDLINSHQQSDLITTKMFDFLQFYNSHKYILMKELFLKIFSIYLNLIHQKEEYIKDFLHLILKLKKK